MQIDLPRTLREPRGACLALGTALLFPMLFTATAPIGDPDVWVMATCGRDFLAKGHLPHDNFYSFTDPSHPWLMHEILPGLVYDAGLTRFGPAFFAGFALVVLAATYAVVFRATLAPRNTLGGALLSLVSLTFAKRLLSARPLATGLFLGALLAEIAWGKRFDARRAVACVALVWLWTNIHGSFPLGVAILAGGAVDAWWNGDLSTLKTRLLAAGGSALATLGNPYGALLHKFVFTHLLGDKGGAFSTSHELIDEFAPIWRDRTIVGPTEKVGAVIVLALALLALTRREHAVRGAFVLALAALGAIHVRHVEQFGFLGVVLLAPCLDTFWPPRAEEAGARPPIGWFVLPPLAVAVVAFAVVAGRRPRDAWLDEHLGGAPMAAALRALPDGAHLYAPYASDGLALWLAAPRGVRVFVDLRGEAFAPEVARADVEIASGSPLAESLLRRYGATSVIARDDSPLRARLAGWRVARRDGGWVTLGDGPDG